MKAKNAVLAAIVVLVAAFVSAAAPAVTKFSVPDDVQSYFEGEALTIVRANSEGEVTVGQEGPDYSEVAGFGTIREIHTWSSAFILGGDASRALVSMNEWIAPMESSGGPAGTFIVVKRDGLGKAEFSSYDNNVELASALQDMPEDGGALVLDPPSGGWYVVRDGAVSGVSTSGKADVPAPIALVDYQRHLAERYVLAMENAAGFDDAVGGGGPVRGQSTWLNSTGLFCLFVGSALLVIGASAALASAVGKRRQRGTG